MHRYAIGQNVDNSGDVISHLNITHVRADDGGLYKCIASNSMGSAEFSARLNVYGESMNEKKRLFPFFFKPIVFTFTYQKLACVRFFLLLHWLLKNVWYLLGCVFSRNVIIGFKRFFPLFSFSLISLSVFLLCALYTTLLDSALTTYRKK